MSKHPRLEWEPSEFGGWEADLCGVILMRVEAEPVGWSVHWLNDYTIGTTVTIETAKAEAENAAAKVLQETLAALGRKP